MQTAANLSVMVLVSTGAFSFRGFKRASTHCKNIKIGQKTSPPNSLETDMPLFSHKTTYSSLIKLQCNQWVLHSTPSPASIKMCTEEKRVVTFEVKFSSQYV
jgi:hypothetical protein